MQWKIVDDNKILAETECRGCNVSVTVYMVENSYCYDLIVSHDLTQVIVTQLNPIVNGVLSEIEGTIHKTLELVKEIQ